MEEVDVVICGDRDATRNATVLAQSACPVVLFGLDALPHETDEASWRPVAAVIARTLSEKKQILARRPGIADLVQLIPPGVRNDSQRLLPRDPYHIALVNPKPAGRALSAAVELLASLRRHDPRYHLTVSLCHDRLSDDIPSMLSGSRDIASGVVEGTIEVVPAAMDVKRRMPEFGWVIGYELTDSQALEVLGQATLQGCRVLRIRTRRTDDIPSAWQAETVDEACHHILFDGGQRLEPGQVLAIPLERATAHFDSVLRAIQNANAQG
jgi:hypothetical protein